MSHEFHGERRVCYGDEEETAVFVPRCPVCSRFVKADKTSALGGDEPNATCSRCGRVRMLFEGFV